MIFILLMPVALILGAGYYFCTRIIYPRVYEVGFSYQHEVEEGKIVESEFNARPKEKILIRSPYGYDLHGYYFPQAGSRKTVVMSHGITWSMYGMVKYMNCFYRRGYNILLYDLRNHGHNRRINTTFGVYEKFDLKAVVDWALDRLGAGGRVGTFGESLGAATTLQHAAIDQRIAFAVLDCPFADLRRLLLYRLREDYHLHLPVLIDLANLWCRLIAKVDIDQASPIAGIPQIQAPMLFLHGANDRYIPPQHSIDMVQAAGERAALYLAPNAGHAQAFWNNREEYERVVGEFLQKIEG